MTVTNAGPSAANGFSITDVVPPAITGVTVLCAVTGTGACGVNGSSGNSISFTNASLAAGDGNALTLTVSGTIDPDATGALVNTATVMAGAGSTDVNPANDSATDTDTRGAPQVDLAITKTDGQTTYVPGTAITYTIIGDQHRAVDGHRLQHRPTRCRRRSPASPPPARSLVTGICGTPGTLDGNVSFTNASLPPGAGNALTLTVRGTIGPSTSGAIANTATVTPGAGAIDVNTSNNSATDIDTPGTSQIDLAVTKTDGTTTYVPGTAITYTITVTNAGPSTAAGFSITDTVPAAITGVTASCAVTGMASCGTNGSSSGNAISFAGLSVAPGAGNAITLTVSGIVSPDATGDLTNTATAAAGAGSTDANTGNNSATDTDTPGVSQVDLAIAKTNGQTAYVPGTPISYTITVTNAGPSTATGVTHQRPRAGGHHRRDRNLHGHRPGQLRHQRFGRQQRELHGGDARPRRGPCAHPHRQRNHQPRRQRPARQRGDGDGRPGLDRPEPRQQHRHRHRQRRAPRRWTWRSPRRTARRPTSRGRPSPTRSR